jgi:hypothetical protein
MSIKMDEYIKKLKITNKSWDNPIHNGLDLTKIHTNVMK